MDGPLRGPGTADSGDAAELHAAGAPTAAPQPRDPALTAREHPNAVEYHLKKVFRKLLLALFALKPLVTVIAGNRDRRLSGFPAASSGCGSRAARMTSAPGSRWSDDRIARPVSLVPPSDRTREAAAYVHLLFPYSA